MTHDGKKAVLSKVLTWYITNGEMTWYLGMERSNGFFHGTDGIDIVNFAGNLSFEICKFGHEWETILNKAKYSSLIILLGAGGAVIYFWRKSIASPDTSPRSPGLSARSFIKWLFDEELVEDEMENTSDVHGYYFGPILSNNEHGSSEDADEEDDSDDLSLNSLSAKSSPHKFLKKPFFDISLNGSTARFKNNRNNFNTCSPVQITHPCPKCVKGTCRLKKHQLPKNSSNSSSCYSGSPKTQMKTSIPEFLYSEEDQILQKTFASNRLTYRYYRPG